MSYNRLSPTGSNFQVQMESVLFALLTHPKAKKPREKKDEKKKKPTVQSVKMKKVTKCGSQQVPFLFCCISIAMLCRRPNCTVN